MILEIPVPTGPYTTQTIDLDGVTYRLNFRWNTRESAWYLDISEYDDTMIAAGIKVVPNLDLSTKFKALGAPEGAIVTMGESAQATRPGRNEFGGRVKLYYFDAAEIETIQNATTATTSGFVVEEVVTVTPVPTYAYVGSDGTTLSLIFSTLMVSPGGSTLAGISVTVDATPVAVSAGSISGNVISMALATAVNSLNTVLVSFDKSTGDLESDEAIRLESFTDFPVTPLAIITGDPFLLESGSNFHFEDGSFFEIE